MPGRIITLWFVLTCCSVSAQDSLRFANFHGIEYEGNQYFEAEGQQIFIRSEARGLDPKSLNKLIKKYNMKGAQRTDTLIRNQAIVFVKQEMENGLASYSVCYFLETDDDAATVIGFAGYRRDVDLEHLLINAYLNQTIPENIFTSSMVSTVNFAGRIITLGGACRWMSPHNLQCPDYGQMSWSLFDSEQAARANRDLQLTVMKNKSLTNILEEKEVPVVFEGINVSAKRVKVKIAVPRLIMGGSNVLMVYYVTANVRGKFVTCVLSQYTDDVNGKSLAPLLREVMTLKE